MDAVEYLKTKRRLCKAHTECRGCPLNSEDYGYPIGCPCGELERENVEDLVRRVEKWAKEHPARTRQSVFLELYPNAKTAYGNVDICPAILEGKKCAEIGSISGCIDCEGKYWSQEVPNDD